jgi:hypothetical protein
MLYVLNPAWMAWAALHLRGQEYHLERRLFLRLSIGEVIG